VAGEGLETVELEPRKETGHCKKQF